jgi:5-bromo-4-chloroindolyl phosphate hydrolysis protein
VNETRENRPTVGLAELLLGTRPSQDIRGRVSRRRGRLLFVLPLPMLIAALAALGSGKLGAFIANAGGFSLFMAAAYLTRRGFRELGEPPRRRFGTRRLSELPLQSFGGALLALATGLSAFFGAHYGLANSLAFAAVAAVGFHLLYGFAPPPRSERRFDASVAAKAVAAALAEAEDRLIAIERASRSIANPELRERLGRIASRGRQILEQLAARPQSVRRARKFLTVYLEGAQQVSEGYARTHRAADSRELEQNFRNVLITIEDVFAEQEQRLLETDLMDLDVQIEVLTNQLKREGII